MREAVLPRGRIVLNDRDKRRAAKPPLFARLFNVRRMGATAVLGIAGLAAIGVPMNALFFQDGSHPSPLFATHAPPKPAVVEEAKIDNTETGNIEPAPAPAPKPAVVKRGDLAEDELAALSAEPVARPIRVTPKPEAAKPTAAKPAAAKPAPTKPVAAKPAAPKVVAPTAAGAKPTEKPVAANAQPAARPVTAKPVAAKPVAAKPVAAKPGTPTPPKPIAAKPATPAPAKTAAVKEESGMNAFIGNLLRGGEPKR